ncbi:helix-turn-helix transcriptional regulator [Bacillus paramycoides]|uniref:helix-turn-helix transcriptional regulator n=1 Tax=Bacillus paramycoides TaxID=2026194 RepID=UPI002E1ECF59|nr:helix-turn-helix transcriptional regulator [Bacillus paramycoides]
MKQQKFTIKQARNISGLTQPEMAKQLGMSLSSYIEYENYKFDFRISKAIKFSLITGVSFDDILFLNENYTSSAM